MFRMAPTCEVEIVQRTPGERRIVQLQLEAAQLQHDRLTRPDFVQLVDQGHADVAAYMDRFARRAQHQPDQGGSRRLAAAARDGNDRPEPCLRGKLQRQQAVVAQRECRAESQPARSAAAPAPRRSGKAGHSRRAATADGRPAPALPGRLPSLAISAPSFSAGAASLIVTSAPAATKKRARARPCRASAQNDDSFAAKYAVFHDSPAKSRSAQSPAPGRAR